MTDGRERERWQTVHEAIDDLPSVEAGEVGDDPAHETRSHRPSTVAKYRAAEYGDTPHGGESPRVLYPDEPAWTVVVGDGKTPIHYEEPRMLTPREIARLQTIPDGFVLPVESRREKCRLAGNAVPPLLAANVLGELP